MAECPICGVEFASEGSVKGHITRKTDEDHAGLSGPDVLEGEDVDDSSDTSESSSASTSSNPTMGGGDPSSSGGDQDGDELEVPCGCGTIDPTAIPEGKYHEDDRGRKVTRITCDDCGESHRLVIT